MAIEAAGRASGQQPSGQTMFISYTAENAEVALRAGDALRAAGHMTVFQDTDLGRAGFMARMAEAFDKAGDGAKVVALLSRAYLASEYCLAEAHFPLSSDPQNEQQRLVVLRVEECAPLGALRSLSYVDLVPLMGDATRFAQAVRGAVSPGRDKSAADIAAHYRRSANQIIAPSIRPVPGFTGREAELSAINAALWQKDGRAALTSAGAPSQGAEPPGAGARGPGGVGKSVIAREYAWRNRDRYAGVWWVDGETRETLLNDITELGARLMPGLDEVADRTLAGRITIDALSQSRSGKPWLIIYDNVAGPDDIGHLIPAANTHALITSRRSGWDGEAQEIPIDVFPRPTAIEFLLERARQPDAQAAGRLADDLGCLPLALAHARATCWTMGLGFDAYREKLPELMKRTPSGSPCPASVFATVDLAAAKAFAQCPSAETLLGIAAYLGPERIPLDILTDDVVSESERGKAVAALREVLLAEPHTLDDGTDAISVHRLVQQAMKERLRARSSATLGAQAANEEKAVVELATRLVANAYPAGNNGSNDVRSWSRCKLLEPHVASILAVAPGEGDVARHTSHLLNQHGQYLRERTDFAAAEPLYRRALQIDERLHGPEHAHITTQLGNLASLFLATDRVSEAEPLMRRALQINESSFGAEHPNVAISLNKLAHLLHRTNRLADAEPLYRRALAIDEKAHGSEHAVVASDLNNLARLLQDMGRFEDAEALFRRALAIDEAVHAANHPAVAIGLNNLAGLLQETDRFAEAEPLMRRAVSIFEASLGNDHPDTSVSVYNLAELLRTTNRPAEAEPLLRRVLGIDEKIYGSDHLTVATDLTNLAHLLQNMSKAADAEPLMRRAMHILESSLGPDHPDSKAARADHASIMAVVQAIQDRLDADEAKRLGKYKAAHASPYPVTHIPVPEASVDQRRPGLFSRLLGRR